MADDEYDHLPDDFADLEGVDWAALMGETTSTPANVANLNAQAPASVATLSTAQQNTAADTSTAQHSFASAEENNSSSYFSDGDDMDASFLAEIDLLEQKAFATLAPTTVVSSRSGTGANVGQSSIQASRRTGTSSGTSAQSTSNVNDFRSSRHFPNPSLQSMQLKDQHSEIGTAGLAGGSSSNVPSKRPCPDDTSHFISPKRKGKMKATDSMQDILAAYEDELTCPICCDLLVGSHVGNPCGHTFCGECGLQWHIENNNKGCPCCRQTLDRTTPMIPNIAIDNTVAKHVRALALSGAREWEVDGRKCLDWMARAATWREGAAKRERKKARLASARSRPSISMGSIQLFEMVPDIDHDLGEDPTYVDSDDDLIPRPIRRARRGRRQASAMNIFGLSSD